MSERVFKNSLSGATVLLLSLLVCFLKLQHEPSYRQEKSIGWDVYGYYVYLPATFIHHDPGYENRQWQDEVQKKYAPSPTVYQIHSGKGNRKVNAYSVGMAAVYLPGFLIAHTYAHLTGELCDGFSPPYQWAVMLTGLFFACLGIFLLRMVLLHFFTDELSALLLFLIVLGTNYLFQAGFDGTMPHNFLFSFNCLIILCTIRWYTTFKIKYLIGLAFILGWATVCRPTELIWMLFPLLWGMHDAASEQGQWKLYAKHKKQISVFFLCFFLAVLPQIAYWYWATGNFFVVIRSEKLSLFDPYTWRFLFSFKKGWLIYTPVMIFAILGFFRFYKERKEVFFSFAFVFMIHLYLVSCWENWWYGASFGSRPMVEVYGLLSVPLGFLIQGVWKKRGLMKPALGIALIFCVCLCLFQTWQMLVYILDGERMTAAYYWRMFGKTIVYEDDRKLLSYDIWQNDDVFKEDEKLYVKKEIYKMENRKSLVLSALGMNQNPGMGPDSLGLKLDTAAVFNPVFIRRYYDLTSAEYLWFRISADVFPLEDPGKKDAFLVMTQESEGRSIHYKAIDLNTVHAPAGKWTTLSETYLTAYIRHKDDLIKCYFWNPEKNPGYIRNFRIEMLEPKAGR